MFVEGEWITAAHPMVVAAGVDAFGGSGIEPLSTNSALCDSNPLTGPGLSGTCISVTGIGGPYAPYTGPVELDSGTDQVVCAYSVDVAGNQETPSAAIGSTSCTEPLDIDNDLPTGSVTVAPPAPTGNAPWYDGDAPVPTVTFSAYNGTGSPAPAGGGFRYRVDNSTEFTCGNGCVVSPALLGRGCQRPALDGRGQRRQPGTRAAGRSVTSTSRTPFLRPSREAPKADGANGWHQSRSRGSRSSASTSRKGTLDLRPIGSGVDEITYTLDGDARRLHRALRHRTRRSTSVCLLADDVAGNDEADGVEHCTRIAYDPDDPTTSILQNGSLTPADDGDNGWYKPRPGQHHAVLDRTPRLAPA